MSVNTTSSNIHSSELPSEHFNGKIEFTSDDVYDAWLKGKNHLGDEVRKILTRTIPLSTSKLPDILQKIVKESGIEITHAYMKVDGLSAFQVLCIISQDDYLSANMRQAYIIASEIEAITYDNSYNFYFSFIMQSDDLSIDCIRLDGYNFPYGKENQA